jgi:myo-inositol 2-dehydrogenase/D-chiro-inositol 1-dehydrogenase
VDVRDHGLRIHSEDGLRLPDAAHWPLLHGRVAGDLAEQLRHFAVALRTGAPFLMDVDDAISTAAVNDAILRAVRSGRAEDVERDRVR